MVRFNANEVYGEKFYQIPKVFMTNEKYRKLTADTKLAYGILKDRFSLSVSNGWLDENNEIYFIYTIEKLMEILHCSNKTVVNIKKALINAGLLESRKMGRGFPDRLYLHKPEVNENDIYLIQKSETLGAVETCKNYTSKNVKSTSLEMYNLHPNDTKSNNTNINNTDNNLLTNKAVTKIQILDVINSFYREFSIGRWDKEKWLILAEKLSTDIYEGSDIHSINDWYGYIKACLRNIAHRHDLKYGKKEVIEINEDGLVPFYNWLDGEY